MQSDCSISAKSNGSESSSHSIQLQMRTIISEFKSVYQQKLKVLDEEEKNLASRPESVSIINDKLRLKVKTLESYVKDLLEQNDVLVQTVDELEREANSRVAKLENKIHKLNGMSKVETYLIKSIIYF